MRTVDALGHQVRSQFDDSGNLVEVAPDGGGPTTFSYDGQGNHIGVTDPLGATLTNIYDPTFSRLTSATDPLGHITTFSLDAIGNTTAATYVNGRHEEYSYDAQGNLVRTVDRNGKSTMSSYDERGLLTSLHLSDGSTITYTYDAHSNLISATDGHGTIRMQYDTADRLIGISYPRGRSLSYSYDGDGRLVRSADQGGFAVNYRYDAAGRLGSISGGGGTAIAAYTYNATGRLARISKGNRTSTTFEYDAAGHVTHLVNLAPDNSVNSRFDYTYDALGRRESVTTLEGRTVYSYDADSRLTSVVLPNGRTLTYVYDVAGNRVGTIDNGAATAYTTNDLNEYVAIGATTESYDSAGNLLNSSGPQGNVMYTYDSLNRLIGVTGPSGTVSYEYDALGHRVASVRNGQSTEFVVDPGGNMVSEYNSSGGLTAHYTYGSALTSRVDSEGAAAYYDFDAIGSTAGLTALDGQYANRYSYLPFGETLSAVEGVSTPFRYVGALGVQDEQNGLNFMRARFYIPAQGRFTQSDPIGLAGGANLYTYAENNPVSLADSSGLLVNPWYVNASPEEIAELTRSLEAAAAFNKQYNPLAYEPVPPVPEPVGSYPSISSNPLANRVGPEAGGIPEKAYWETMEAYVWGPQRLRLALGESLKILGEGFLYGAAAMEAFDFGRQNGEFFYAILNGERPPCWPMLAFHTCAAIPGITASSAGHTSTVQVSGGSIDRTISPDPAGSGLITTSRGMLGFPISSGSRINPMRRGQPNAL